MRISGVVFLSVVVFSMFLNGCATTGSRKTDEVQSLRSQVAAMEDQLRQKDAEIDSLRRTLSSTTEEKYMSMKSSVETDRPSIRQIQTALKNAGYDPGVVDGKMGNNTRSAIRSFQRDNGLSADGKVGRQTWSVLSQYLDKVVSK